MYCLRELEKKDIETINKWRNDQELIAFLGAPFRYINLDVDIKWYENYMGNRGNAVRCAISDKENDKIVGIVSLVGIDYLNQSAVFNIMIGDKEQQGKGIGTFATNAMLAHAFGNMNLQRVELFVLEDNKRAIGLYEKCGFIYEGKKRNARYKNGKFVDLLMYSILKEEYYTRRENDMCVWGGQPDLPSWSIDYTVVPDEVDKIIKECSATVSGRENYIGHLKKIILNGDMVYAYGKEYMGYCAFYANNDKTYRAYITSIAVKEKYQGKHVGKQLLHACLKIASAKGMKSCMLEVNKDNYSAIKFYEKNGFNFFEENKTSFFMLLTISE